MIRTAQVQKFDRYLFAAFAALDKIAVERAKGSPERLLPPIWSFALRLRACLRLVEEIDPGFDSSTICLTLDSIDSFQEGRLTISVTEGWIGMLRREAERLRVWRLGLDAPTKGERWEIDRLRYALDRMRDSATPLDSNEEELEVDRSALAYFADTFGAMRHLLSPYRYAEAAPLVEFSKWLGSDVEKVRVLRNEFVVAVHAAADVIKEADDAERSSRHAASREAEKLRRVSRAKLERAAGRLKACAMPLAPNEEGSRIDRNVVSSFGIAVADVVSAFGESAAEGLHAAALRLGDNITSDEKTITVRREALADAILEAELFCSRAGKLSTEEGEEARAVQAEAEARVEELDRAREARDNEPKCPPHLFVGRPPRCTRCGQYDAERDATDPAAFVVDRFGATEEACAFNHALREAIDRLAAHGENEAIADLSIAFAKVFVQGGSDAERIGASALAFDNLCECHGIEPRAENCDRLVKAIAEGGAVAGDARREILSTLAAKLNARSAEELVKSIGLEADGMRSHVSMAAAYLDAARIAESLR